MEAQTLVTAYRAFGADLLRELYADRPGANLLIAPVSLATATLLAYEGAQGDTAGAIAAALRLPHDSTPDGLRQASADLQSRLKQLDRKYARESAQGAAAAAPARAALWYQMACGMWLASGSAFHQDYLRRVREVGSTADIVTTADAINRWVDAQTLGRISTILKEVQPLASYLLSAAYFKGGFAKPFPAADTTPAPFHNADGSVQMVPMMQIHEELPYHEDAQAQYAALPLGHATMNIADAYLLIILPRPGTTLGRCVAAADGAWWQQGCMTIHRTMGYKGTLRLPRFRIGWDGVLNTALQAMGMGPAFSERADFGAMTPLPTQISAVAHSTYLAVNEEGVEASAATAVKLASFGAHGNEPFEMTVDRPFLLAIVAKHSLALLHMGVVTRPEVLP